MANRFGLRDLEDACAYAADPVLGPRLAEAFHVILSHPTVSAEQILGEVDAMKLRSCATLFACCNDTRIAPLAREVLHRFYRDIPCPLTLQMLSKDESGIRCSIRSAQNEQPAGIISSLKSYSG